MAVTIELSKYSFADLFKGDRADQFSRCALEALFEDLEELSEGIGKDVQVDIVEICCNWTEYEGAELLRAYPNYLPDDLSSYDDEDEAVSALIGALRDETRIIELSNGCTLVQAF